MSTADKLNALIQTKADIKQALIDKGVEVNDVFSTYAEAITNLSTGSGGSSGGIFDFAAIGYTGNEPSLKAAYDYAKQIYDNWDPNITDCSNKFSKDTNLIFCPKLETPNVTNTEYMFNYCQNLLEVPAFDTSNVTNMKGMFKACTLLRNIPAIDTSKVTNMSNAFDNCSQITSITLDTSSCVDMYGLFVYCSLLESVTFTDTSKCTNMTYMFQNCSKLKTIINLDTSNNTNMYQMFYYCQELEELPAMDTSKVTYMSSFIYNDSKLRRINSISVKSDSQHTTSDSYLCSWTTMNNLSYMLIKDLGTLQDDKGWNFSRFPVWGINDDYNPDARQSLIDSLITYSFDRTAAGFSPITITLHANVKALLTEDEIAQITAKGFTIA